MGCSTHSVPSWSKVAMRPSCGTKLLFDWSVVVFTKLTIDCLAGPSFHEGSGSVCASACAPKASPAMAASAEATRRRTCNFMAASLKEKQNGFSRLKGHWPGCSNFQILDFIAFSDVKGSQAVSWKAACAGPTLTPQVRLRQKLH